MTSFGKVIVTFCPIAEFISIVRNFPLGFALMLFISRVSASLVIVYSLPSTTSVLLIACLMDCETVITKDAEAVFPAESLALQDTIVSPIENNAPLSGLHDNRTGLL